MYVASWRGSSWLERSFPYPPFSRLAMIRVEAMSEDLTRDSAAQFARQARLTAAVKRADVEVVGPAAAPIARLRGRYRYRVMFRAKARPALRHVLNYMQSLREHIDRRVRVIIDVDPVSML